MFRLILLCSVLLTFGCNPGPEGGCNDFFFPVEIQTNIDSSFIKLNEKLIVTISLSNNLTDNENTVKQTSEESLDIAMALQKYNDFEQSSLNKSPYCYYDSAIGELDIRVIKGQMLEDWDTYIPGVSSTGFLQGSAQIFKPEQTQTDRILELEITPNQKDTFVIHFVSSQWITFDEDNECSSFNKLKFENNTQVQSNLVATHFERIDEQLEFEINPGFDNSKRFQEFDGGILLIVN